MSAPSSVADAIAAREADVAELLTRRHFDARPELERRYGTVGRQRCLEDASYHLRYVVQAIRLGRAEIFSEYATWASSMLESRGIPPDDLVRHVRDLVGVVAELLPGTAPEIEAVTAPALEALGRAQSPVALAPSANASLFLNALRHGGARAASAFVNELLATGVSLQDIYIDVFEASQHEVGRLWQTNQISVAEEHYYTAATQVVIAQLYPRLFAVPTRGPAIVVACVAGELHEIGPRMVADLLQLEGFNTHFVGANVPTRDLVQFVEARRAVVLGLSATTSPNLTALESAIQAIRENENTRHVKIMVGGYPFVRVPGLWRSVGADAFAASAREAIALVTEMTSS